MAPPIAKSSSDDILDRLNEILRSGQTPTELELARYKKEARKLLSTQPLNGNIMLGALACLECDVDKMNKYHLAALAIDPNNFSALRNYAASLANIGNYPESLKYTVRAYKSRPGSPELLSRAVSVSVYAGHIREALDWLEQWQRENPDEEHEAAELVRDLAAFAKELAISDSQMESVIKTGIQTINEYGIYSHGVSLRLVEDDESEWLSYVINVERDVDEVVNLNIELAERIAAAIQDEPISGFVLRYTTRRREAVDATSCA